MEQLRDLNHSTVTTLSERDAEKFMEALEETEPNEKLKEAIEAHNDLIDDD